MVWRRKRYWKNLHAFLQVMRRRKAMVIQRFMKRLHEKLERHREKKQAREIQMVRLIPYTHNSRNIGS
jgi:hypothetical protein